MKTLVIAITIILATVATASAYGNGYYNSTGSYGGNEYRRGGQAGDSLLRGSGYGSSSSYRSGSSLMY